MNADEDYPDRVGIMVLPWVSLFPGCLLPLHIFEKRYRDMCTQALAGNRMFAIAHSTEESDCEELGGLGVIRAGVTKPDGTMDIILQGVTRVEFSDFRMNPYPQASIRILNDPPYDPDSYADLRRELMDALKVNLETIDELPKGLHRPDRSPRGFYRYGVLGTGLESTSSPPVAAGVRCAIPHAPAARLLGRRACRELTPRSPGKSRFLFRLPAKGTGRSADIYFSRHKRCRLEGGTESAITRQRICRSSLKIIPPRR